MPIAQKGRPLWRQMLLYFLPILMGAFFQQLYNTIDAMVVGKYVGKVALASVGGSTGTLINLLVGFFVGPGERLHRNHRPVLRRGGPREPLQGGTYRHGPVHRRRGCADLIGDQPRRHCLALDGHPGGGAPAGAALISSPTSSGSSQTSSTTSARVSSRPSATPDAR